MKNSRSNKNLRSFWKAIFGIILLFLFLNSCGSTIRNTENQRAENQTFTPPYLENFTEESFKVSIEAYGNNFGGIMVAKRLDVNHYRFAMINEFGGKLLDFELINQNLKLNYAIDQLDRKILLNLLEKDFSMLFSENLPISNSLNVEGHNRITTYIPQLKRSLIFVSESDGNQNLLEIHLAKKKIETIAKLSGGNIRFPNVVITHQNLPIKIFLHLLSDQTPNEI
jgi:hypothetical protein